MKQLRSSRPLLAACVALLLVGGAACGDDDDTSANSDGGAPTTAAADPDDSEDPMAAGIRREAEARGIEETREEDGSVVIVMAEGSTDEDLAEACDYAQSILDTAGRDDTLSAELDGEPVDCP